MRRTKCEWTEIVAAYRNSGLTIRRFCQTEGVVEQSLRNWITRLTMITRDETTPDTARGFVEVRSNLTAARRDSALSDSGEPNLAPRHGRRNGLTIRFRDDAVIEVFPDTDRHTLEWVLTLMEARR